MYFGYFEVVHSERGLLLYLFLSAFFMEIILRWQSGLAFFGQGLFVMALFVLAFILLSLGVFHLFPRRISRILVRIWFVCLTLAYVAQFVYFSIFRTYFSLYSMLGASQALRFYKTILIYMLRDPRWILLFFPFIIYLLINKKLVWVPQGGLLDYSLLFMLSLLIITTLFGMTDNHEHSSRNLLAYSHEAKVTVNRLGILGSGFGEAKRMVLGEKAPYFPPGQAQIPGREANVVYDLGAFLEVQDDPVLSELTSYFLSRKASEKNIFTGRLEGYNLIYIMAEGFSDLALDEKLTPTLYRLMEEGVDFENFYNPLWQVATSDAEYASLTGLLPLTSRWAMVESKDKHMPQSLAHKLAEQGYQTLAFHNYSHDYYSRDSTHKNLGYDFYAPGQGLEVEPSSPASDLELVEKSLDYYKEDQPFHSYYMTMSGLMPYDFVNNDIAKKYEDQVDKMNLSTESKAYRAAHIELDQAVELLIKKLEEKNLLENTLLVLHGDHYPYALKDENLEELAGRELEDFDKYKSRLIFYSPALEGIKISRLASSLDLLPTISNLLGLDFDSRLMMGRDLFSPSQPMVEFVDKSFITPQGIYNGSSGQVHGFEEAEVLEDEDFESGPSQLEVFREKVEKKFYYSRLMLENDYYRHLENYKIIYQPPDYPEPEIEEEEED